jgi:hypothetical protein
MAHAPQINAVAGPKIAMIEPDREALYPGALIYYSVPARPDAERRQRLEKEYLEEQERWAKRVFGNNIEAVWPDLDAPRKYFVPQPLTSYGVACDVCVCPRKREYGAQKNWSYWRVLVQLLTDRGLSVFAAGAPCTTEFVQCPMAPAYTRPLDASIEAMLAAKVVVSTDSGLAHLAVMCGRPLVMISHGEGLVADGFDDVGHPYWPIKLDRFEAENHTGSQIKVVHHAWHDPEVVHDAITEVLQCA